MSTWTTLAGAFLVLALLGCGGPPRAARVAVEQTGGGLNTADEIVADAVSSRGEEMRAQVRRERREARFNEGCSEHTGAAFVDCIVEASLERFEELMDPTNVARSVLRTARESLEAVELALDAWAAGTDEEGGFLQAAACAVAALAELGRAFEAAGLELPSEIAEGLRVLAGFASGACPAPGGS